MACYHMNYDNIILKGILGKKDWFHTN